MKNVDNTLEKMNSTMRQSLGFLDNTNVYVAVVFILFLYNLCVFKNINVMVGNFYEHTIVRIIMLLLVIYVAQKNCVLGLLLGMSYIISLYYNSMMENFENEDMKEEIKDRMDTKMSEMNDEEDNSEDDMNDTNVEGFMTKPGMDLDLSNKDIVDSNSMDNSSINNNLSKKTCMQNYYPQNENVGDVCSPVATYQGEFNAQGLNEPIGYDDNQGGYTI